MGRSNRSLGTTSPTAWAQSASPAADIGAKEVKEKLQVERHDILHK
jgi:hypothetical protein